MSDQRIQFRVASTYADRLRAEYLISDIYNRHYDIVFSRDHYDLDSRIEPYPDQYLVAAVGHEVVAAVGLYTGHTYVERYGEVDADDLRKVVDEAGDPDAYDPTVTAELTKLSVHPDWTGYGIARRLLAAAHSQDFLTRFMGRPPVLLCCATRRIFTQMHGPLGIATRHLRPFPEYSVHDRYRSPDNPMSSVAILPMLDIPVDWWENGLPQEEPLSPYVSEDA